MSDENRPDYLIDSRQLAKELGLNGNWPAIARLKGNGPAHIKVGRSVRYRRSDVDRWLEQRRVEQ